MCEQKGHTQRTKGPYITNGVNNGACLRKQAAQAVTYYIYGHGTLPPPLDGAPFTHLQVLVKAVHVLQIVLNNRSGYCLRLGDGHVLLGVVLEYGAGGEEGLGKAVQAERLCACP